jgi:small GTP-binding protein
MTSEDINYHTAKVVLLGQTGVGKTSIISRFTSDKFDPECLSSLGASFVSKEIFFPEINNTIKFDIWDTAGQEKFRSLAKIFYKDAVIIIFVYDVTKRDTFEALKEYWVEQIKENGVKNAILALAANKDDLYEGAVVAEKEGQEYAMKIDAIFKKTSALSNVGIDELFQLIGKKYLNPTFDYRAEEQKLKEEYRRNKMDDDAFDPHDNAVKLTDAPKKKKEGCKGC